jgi:rubrerythrin
MVAEVFAGITAFKEMMEMARALKDLDNAMSRRDVIIALQEKIFAGNAAYSDLLQHKDELEKELMRLKDWEAEKARYALVELYDGALAYAVKEALRGTEPPHYICPSCYQQGKKSILQGTTWHLGEHSLACPVCQLKVTHSWRDAVD